MECIAVGSFSGRGGGALADKDSTICYTVYVNTFLTFIFS